MLRKTLLGVTLLIALVGLICYLLGDRNTTHLIVWGAVMFVLILCERWRYKKIENNSEIEWQSTDEQFIDPETGKPTRVFYNSSTGERKYVSEEEESNF